MTSVVQLWTTTGTTRTPEIQFGADGGNFSTANGYASVAGARRNFRLQLLREPVRHPGTGHQRRLLQLAARRQCRSDDSPTAWRFACGCATTTTGRASSRTGGSTAIRCCRPTRTNTPTRTISWPAATLRSAGRAHGSTSSAATSTTTLTLEREPGRRSRPSLRHRLQQPDQVQHRRLRLPGTCTPRGRGRKPRSATPSRTRTATSTTTRTSASARPTACASTIICSRSRASCGSDCRAGRSWLCQQHQLRRQGQPARVGHVLGVARQCDFQRHPPALRLRGRHQGAQLRADVRHLRERFPRCPIPICNPNRTRRSRLAVQQSLFGNRLSLSALYYHNQFHDQIEYVYNSDRQHQPVRQLQQVDVAGSGSGVARPASSATSR